MSKSLGISCTESGWRTCLLNDSHIQEYYAGTSAHELSLYVEQCRSVYGDLRITIAAPSDTSLSRLQEVVDKQIESVKDSRVARCRAGELPQLLVDCVESLGESYHLPGMRHVASVPRYRQLVRSELGDAVQVAVVAALLYRMRLREAEWQEMRFLCLVVGQAGYQISVIVDGQIVDGSRASFVADGDKADPVDSEKWIEQAFWERLAQDLASLFETHHLEDIIISGGEESDERAMSRAKITERFETRYQFYEFPPQEDEPEGFVAANGAAIIGAGLAGSGQATEVTQWMFGGGALNR